MEDRDLEVKLAKEIFTLLQGKIKEICLENPNTLAYTILNSTVVGVYAALIGPTINKDKCDYLGFIVEKFLEIHKEEHEYEEKDECTRWN